MDRDDSIRFVVGAEKRLVDIVAGSDAVPLLRAALHAGATDAEIRNGDGEVLWSAGGTQGGAAASRPLLLEGEPAGSVTVRGEEARSDRLEAIAAVLHAAVDTIVTSNLKRMLTTEMHTEIVNRSYEDLVETNRKLAASETRYRELAESLEIKVRERTEELKQAHVRLLQQEKLASVGQLAAGISHEINNPLGFITSNLSTLGKYFGRCREMLELFRTGRDRQEALDAWSRLKIDFVLTDSGDLIQQSLDGAGRVARIVADLRGFSHIDDGPETAVDVNREIDRTLSVLSPRIPPDAEIIRVYGSMASLTANPALLCQAFLNIIRNAVDAKPAGLRLVVTTAAAAAVVIRFEDNGPGVPEEIRSRIFEPFFTTRGVGKGTGMGLAVAYDAVRSCGGRIDVDSAPDGGAAFTITLPLGITQ